MEVDVKFLPEVEMKEPYPSRYTLEEVKKMVNTRVFNRIYFDDKRMSLKVEISHDISTKFEMALLDNDFELLSINENSRTYLTDLYSLSDFINYYYNRIQVFVFENGHRYLTIDGPIFGITGEKYV